MTEQVKNTDSEQNKANAEKNDKKPQNSVLDSEDENVEILNNLNEEDSVTSMPKKENEEKKLDENEGDIEIQEEEEEEDDENALGRVDDDELEEQVENIDISKLENQNLDEEVQITKDITVNSTIQENGQANGKKFCKICQKIDEQTCEEHPESSVPYKQLIMDFQKYKLYSEQYDPLFNIQKGLNKIKEALSHINIPALQEDYVLKKKIFKQNSKLEDYLDKIIYRQNKLLIDDLHLLPNLDDLKRESYLIDMIQSNQHFVKQYLVKAQEYRYENQNLKNTNPKNKKQSLEILGNRNPINIKRNQSFLTQNGQDEEQTPQKRLKQEDDDGFFQKSNLISNNSYEDNVSQQYKNPSYDVGLENMNPKEQEVLKIMYTTTYEKHHHFREIEKKIFAKFALLRKIKNGITVSVTTDQWRLNRITVQIWLDKYKKQFAANKQEQ